MLQSSRLTLICCAILALLAGPQSRASAQVCTRNLGCASDLVCDKAFIGLIGSCRLAFCNTGADCAVTRRVTSCVEGLCRARCSSDNDCPRGLECQQGPGRTVGACFVASNSGSGSG